MWQMYAVVCAVTILECSTLHEDPPRIFDTRDQCLSAAVEKEKSTREFLTDEDGYLTVDHLEVGCKNIFS